jgi:hypothetical protein
LLKFGSMLPGGFRTPTNCTTVAPEDAITVLSGRISAEGQQSSVDAKFAFVSLEAEGDGYDLVYRWPAQANGEHADSAITG